MIYYLIAILDNFKLLLLIAECFLFMALIVIGGSSLDNKLSDEDHKEVASDFSHIFIAFIIVSLSLVFVPSQKQAAFIIVAPAIVENKDVQETVKNIPELTKLGTEYLKEMLKNETKAINE